MKLRNLLAAATAAIVGTSALAASAGAYEAFLMFTDANWAWGNWDAASFPAGNCNVEGDGTYTVYVDSSMESALVEDEETGELVVPVATGAQVFCVDIDGLATAMNAGKDAEGYDDCKTGADKMAFAKAAGVEISDVKVTTTNSDGTTTDVAVNQDNVIFGDIEGNGKIRIEIFNAYGDTVNNPAVDVADINFDEKIAVTFTVSGIGGDAAADDTTAPVEDTTTTTTDDTTTSTTTDKTSPETGVEGIAVVAGVAALAAGALVVSKKRK